MAAVVATSFGDIFRSNCLKNFLLPLVLGEPQIEALADRLTGTPDLEIRIDLPAQTIAAAGGSVIRFEIDPGEKDRLLIGKDEIELTLEYEALIEAFERERSYFRR